MSELELRVSAADFGALARKAKDFDKTLSSALRKQIRNAGKPVVDAVKAEILKTPPSGGKRSAGVRTALAAGTSLRIGTPAKGQASIRITTSPSKLPAGRQAMARTYNQRSWRHPVFGDRDTWAQQAGRPYFGTVILERQAEFAQAVDKAVDEAAAVLRSAGRL